MKTCLHTLFDLLGTLFLVVSCAKESHTTTEDSIAGGAAGQTSGDNSGSGQEADKVPLVAGQTVSLRMTLPDELTRLGIAQDGEDADGAVKLSWEIGDVIRIIDANDASNAAVFTLSSIVDAHNAVFTGEFIEADSFNILLGAESVAAATATAYASQTQNGNASTAHLGYIALLEGVELTDSDWETGVTFSSAWASSHTGSFKHTGAMRLRILLPDIASAVKKVTLTAPSALFYTTNALSTTTASLEINFSASADVSSSHILTVYAALPWQDVAVPSDTDFDLTIETADHDFYHRSFASGGKTYATGSVNAIKLVCDDPSDNVTLDDFAGGAGVSGNPYLLGNARQMENIRAHLSAGNTVYFKMIDDIDLSGVANWTPINYEAQNKFIDFDGDDHTISHLTSDAASNNYPSLFGVFYGSAYDLTIDQATITPGSSKSGVFAGFIGSNNNYGACTVSNVTVSNSNVGTSSVKGSTFCGGFVGQISATSGVILSDITVSGTKVYTTTRAGGLVASIEAASSGTVNTVSLSNITVSSCTVSAGAYAGGAIGEADTPTSLTGTNTVTGTPVSGTLAGGVVGYANTTMTISGCNYSGSTVTASNRYAGGLVASAANYSTTITDCHVENATIDVSGITSTDPRAGGFVGLLENAVTISGCSVGTSSQKITVKLGTPSASNTKHNCGGFVGVHYGTITKNGNTRTTAYATLTCTNTNTGYQLNVGGFGGYVRGTIEYADANVTMTGFQGSHIGGFAGYATKQASSTPCLIDHCTVTGSVTGNNYTGGFIGYVDANTPVLSNNTASGTVSGQSGVGGFSGWCVTGSFSDNTTSVETTGSNTNIGGFIGRATAGTFTGNTATGNTSGTNNNIGGFAGTVDAGTYTGNAASGTVSGLYNVGGLIGTLTGGAIRQCWASGAITATRTGDATSGGLIGYINGASTVENCYATGNVTDSGQYAAGLIGRVTDATVPISNCYASGTVTGSGSSSRGLGGLIGRIDGSNVSVSHCVAWNSSVTATSYGSGAWSSGCVVGVAFPSCTLTDNYRKPGMSLTAYWVPTADYQHANVSSSSTLIKQDGNHCTATALSSGQDGYPQYPYHGKVDADKTLWQLVSNTLGWNTSTIWQEDPSTHLPVLR